MARRLGELLQERQRRVAGFVTDEIRERGRRVGFRIESFDGDSGTLAHVSLPGPPTVGRYGVDLEAFERVALPTLEAAGDADVLLLDELGKMELASPAFCDATAAAFDGNVPVVATVHVFRHPFTDALKHRDDVERISVTRNSRDALPGELAARLHQAP